ncbi:MAG: MarR family transcriptional regulator [Pseudomonadota bacterium]|nr:MarR family transcriptional regulator [Pseudomonadota bacterium]
MSAARHYRIYHKLQIASHRIQKSADRAILSDAPLTTAQTAVLGLVEKAGEVSQKCIADQLGLHESAVTTMVSRLGKLGFMSKRRDEKDRRVWLLSVTNEGKQAREAAGPAFARINQRIESELSDEEIAKLADMLDRLNRRFSSGDT